MTFRRQAGHKYNNTWCEANGHHFQSKWERDLYLINLAREQAGEIHDLRLQVTYHLDVNGVHICDYRADFVYFENVPPASDLDPPGVEIIPLPLWEDILPLAPTCRLVVEDAKGVTTPDYLLKKKLMLACHDIEIRETHRQPKGGARGKRKKAARVAAGDRVI